MITYSDYQPVPEPHAVIDGELVPVDQKVLHVLAVNAMALAVGMPSTAPESDDQAALATG